MSIQVENNLKNNKNPKLYEQKAHYVPCKIESDGPANVEKYFEPFVIEKDNGGTFRGHPLDGVKMSFPAGYRALQVTEAKKPLADDADRKFQVVGGFKEFVYWNWDKRPSKNDNIVKALDWIDIAEALYELPQPCDQCFWRLANPITDEDLKVANNTSIKDQSNIKI